MDVWIMEKDKIRSEHVRGYVKVGRVQRGQR